MQREVWYLSRVGRVAVLEVLYLTTEEDLL